jgi:hypothetical protein
MLRSMLSRAVEDQLVDQHEIASLMSDMRSQLMRFGQEIAGLRAHGPRDDSSDAQINSVTVELREAVRFLSERIDGVTRMVAQRGEDLADIRGALTAVDAHVRSQAETIGLLSAGLQSLPSYGEQISVLADNLAIVHRQLVAIDVAVNAAAAPSEDRLSAIEASVMPLAATMSELTAAVASVRAQVEPLASDVTAIGGHVTGLVEGTADGAALDSRVRESVSTAIQLTEQRLIEHIDEAVFALAQTLLKRRPVSIATPVAEPAAAEPAMDEPAAAEPEPVVAEFEPGITDGPVLPDETALADEPVPTAEPVAAMTSSMEWMSEFAALDAQPSDPSINPPVETTGPPIELGWGEEQTADAPESPTVAMDFPLPAAGAPDSAEAAAQAGLDLDPPGFGEPGFDDAQFDDDAHEVADRQMLAAVDFLESGPPVQADDAPVDPAAYDASPSPVETEPITVAPPVETAGWAAPVADEAAPSDDAPPSTDEPPVADVAPADWPDAGVIPDDPPAPDASDVVEPEIEVGDEVATVPVPVPSESAPGWPPPDQSPTGDTVLPEEVPEPAPEPKRRWFRSG